MSEHEFEMYLGVLTRLLRLDPAQREALAAELRDHFDERLAELDAAGLSHDDAVRRALEEFGDAAGLAQQFAQLKHQRRRRILMRLTTLSLSLALVIGFVCWSSWPIVVDQHGRPALVAQDNRTKEVEALPAEIGVAESAPRVRPPQPTGVEVVLERLKTPISVVFVETPLKEALHFISETAKVPIHISRRDLEDLGVTTDTLVTLTLKDVPARTILNMVMDDVSRELDILVRDNFVTLTTKERAARLVVYNCSDLLPKSPQATDAAASVGGMALYGSSEPMKGSPPSPYGTSLQHVVCESISPSEWTRNGGAYTLEVFNGLMVVRAPESVQEEVATLLDMLRKAAASKKPGRVTSPDKDDPLPNLPRKTRETP